jgi:flagellar L-ring protein precursor FlgH
MPKLSPLLAPLLATALLLGGCGAVGRLQAVGKAPPLSPAEPMATPPLQASLGRQGTQNRGMETTPPALPPAVGASLFRTGAGAFFRDQRAGRVGDILTVRIKISDKADLGNATSRTRTGTETAGISALLGLQNPLTKILPGEVDPAKLVDTGSASKSDGIGTISRSETINMTVAATVVGVLPNGNLAIRGKQEVRVNYELRELVISGIVRPEDIARDNSIAHSQIAEARISYGGRGRLTDAQQDRWGQQIYDALFPF